MEECLMHLERFLDIAQHDVVLGAEELRMAAISLERITGRVDYERVLDLIFSTFCIGK